MLIKDIIKDPLEIINQYKEIPNPQIPLPNEIYLPQRQNAKGYDIENETTRLKMINLFNNIDENYKVSSIINGIETKDQFKNVYNPANLDQLLGQVAFASDTSINQSLDFASKFFPQWKNFELNERVKIINKFAQLLEDNDEKLLKICVLEAGKTIKDSIDDLREAIDFCYYYSSEAIRLFSEPNNLKGPTGEKNNLFMKVKASFFL